jgi:GH15 family glucan-1,4-alpha-glucosidase
LDASLLPIPIVGFLPADDPRVRGTLAIEDQLFDRLLSYRNDVGLLAEEYDPIAKRQLGNFSQAFSHLALINTAHSLASSNGPVQQRARGGAKPPSPP